MSFIADFTRPLPLWLLPDVVVGPKTSMRVPPAMSENRRVDVVVVTYNSEETVSQALESAAASFCVESIVVVDNASSDGTVALCRQHGIEVLENQRNTGFASAVNQGLHRGRAPYVLLLNPDAILTVGALDALVTALMERPDAVVAGPLLESKGGAMSTGARRFSTVSNRTLSRLPLLWRLRRLGPEYDPGRLISHGGGVVSVDYVWGAAALCKRAFLELIGGLDERFFLYSEDEDLGRQAAANGYVVLLVMTCTVTHVGGVSSAGNRALEDARIAFANAQLFEKWIGSRGARLYRVGVLLALGATWTSAKLQGKTAAAAGAGRTLVRTARLFCGASKPSDTAM